MALFLANVLWDADAHDAVLAWLVCLVPGYVFRLYLVAAYRRDPAHLAAAGWLTRFRAAYVVHGVGWGLASLMVFPATGGDHQAFLTFAVAGIGASAVIISSFDLVAGLLFLFLTTAPLAARLVWEGDRNDLTMAAVMVLFAAYMTSTARASYRTVVERAQRRHDTAVQAESLSRYQRAMATLRALHASPADYATAAVIQTVAALDLSGAVLWLADAHDAGVLRPHAMAGSTWANHPPLPSLRLADVPAYAGRLAGARALTFAAGDHEPIFDALVGTPWLPPGVRARLDVPLAVDGRLEGMLWCDHGRRHAWTEEEEAFAAAIAAKVLGRLQEGRRLAAEQQLRDLNQNLEQLVAQRTRALTVSEARLAQALDASNDGLWELDLASGDAYYSPVWAQLLGYAPEDVTPHIDFFWQAAHPDDAARVRDEYAAHLEGRQPTVTTELRLRTRGGEYRWFLAKGRIVDHDAAGTPRRMVGTISDITERKRAVQALRDSEERFRAVFDKSPVVVALVRMADRRLAEMNETGLRAFGYSRAEVIGHTAQELQLWAKDSQRPPEFGQRLRDGVVADLEVQLRRKNGEQFWGLLNSSHVTLDGEPYSLNTLLDITERRELESRVLQSQKMEVVGHLAGGIAHDFNNVLTVITGTAELAMADTPGPGPMHDALSTIRDASARAARLTSQLMAFSRRQILQPVPLDLNDVVIGLEPMLRRVVGAAVTLDVVPARQPATVTADRGSLEQVVLNLVINARDAMPTGGTLRIAVDQATSDGPAAPPGDGLRPGRYATIAVSDSGTGMPDAVVQRIFEPFFTTKAVGKGTGLGLSMAHGVVAQSGGAILVRSTVGTGSSFTVHLPWTANAAAVPAAPARAVSAGHETILVVDDNREIREVVRRVLSFAGYRMLTAEHGDDALRVLQEQNGQVDLLLTDVVMPGLTGRDLALRVHAAHPAVRVLFTSGYADDAIARHGVLVEGVQFIAKPYSLQALAQKVRDVLDAGA